MKLLIFLFSVLLLGAAPLPTAPVFPLPDIMHAQLWGNQVLLLHTDKSITLASLFDLKVGEPMEMNSFGYPKVFMDEDVAAGNPSILETAYKSVVGTHTIRTSCKGMSNVRCVEKHKAQVLALQKVFVKIS